MSIYSESDRYMWVFYITYYLAETCLIRLKIVVNKNNNKKENRKGKIMDFIELLKVIFLGIVEGITEWLPISSTGHMILVDEFLKLNVTEDLRICFRSDPAWRDPRGCSSLLEQIVAVLYQTNFKETAGSA